VLVGPGVSATGTDTATYHAFNTATFGTPAGPFGGGGQSAFNLSLGSATLAGTYMFTPTQTGAATPQNVVVREAGFLGGGSSATLTLTGTGVAPLVSGPATNATASTYVLVDSTQTATVTLSVSNQGNAYLAATPASRSVNNTAYDLNGSITGGNSVFVGTAASISLQDANYTGPSKATSAAYAYTFKPTVTGTSSTTVVTSFTDGTGTSNGASAVTSTLSGTGVAPIESVANTTIYGRYGSGASNSGAITVANTGNGNLAGTGTAFNLNGSVTNALGSGFASANTGTVSLASNATPTTASTATSTLGYTYTPGSSRATTTSTITIAFSDGNTNGTNLSQSVAATVTGQAVGPTYASSVKGGTIDTPTIKGSGLTPAAAGATISFGTVSYEAPTTIFLALENITADPNGGNALLTDLTIDRYSITGANASAFSISSIAGSIITEGGMLLVPITVIGNIPYASLSSSLTNFTDESTGLGGYGDNFTYQLTALVVPEPTSLAVLGAGLAGLAAFRRRRQSSQ
jgi:hypothetical protein